METARSSQCSLKQNPIDVPTDENQELPLATSPALYLSHATPEECTAISRLTFREWGDSLDLSQYLEESAHMAATPLSRNVGLTIWILTERNLPPVQRRILASCETYKKQALVALPDECVRCTKSIIHGIASVFCNPAYRGHGYAARMLRELAKVLPNWQSEVGRSVVGSVLYSDIGQKFYTNLGWYPSPNNNHIDFNPMIAIGPPIATAILAKDIEKLCKEDEDMIIRSMSSTSSGRTRMMIIPDLDHMLWHHSKEEFTCKRLFGSSPSVKGAIVGEPGNRMWAIWSHRYYGPLDSSNNTLYILRLVIENQSQESLAAPQDRTKCGLQAEQFRSILEAAHAEAALWKLDHVRLWDPLHLVQKLIERAGIEHCRVQREHDGIASLMWYGKDSDNNVDWAANEHYAWC